MTMVWDKVTITMIGVTCIGILYAIAVSVIAYYKLPLFRIKRYRIIRKHQTFRCCDTEVLGYYCYYIQETYFIFWSNIPDRGIPYRTDGEEGFKDKQRQGNYFKEFGNAVISKNKLRKELELDYAVIKAKKKNKVMKD